MRLQRSRFVLAVAALVIAPLGVTPFAQQASTPTPTPPGPAIESLGMRGFSVALVLGDMQGSGTPDTLPSGAKRAITDMRDFLPYKSYRMLDASWTLCCAGRFGGVSGRLSGLEETEYGFEVYVNGVSGNKMNVTFRLRETGASAEEATVTAVARMERERQFAELVREREALEQEYADLKSKYGENHPSVQTNRVKRETNRRRIEDFERTRAQAGRAPRTAGRSIMESTFSMEVGETVVIGTSRLKSDKALIALLTAATKSTGVREP